MDTRTCTKCNIEKSTTEFSKHKNKDGLKTRCKACCGADSRRWYQQNRQRYIEKKREWIGKNRDLRRGYERKSTIRQYGITPEQYDAMLIAQEGKCWICRNPPTVKEKSLAIDHDHSTGAVRGLLCTDCNFGLGRFKDNQDLLERAKLYLQLSEKKS